MARTPEPTTSLIPAATAFDFLEGAFSRAQRTRRAGLGTALGAVVTLSALALVGLNAGLATSAAEANLSDVRTQDAAAATRLSQIDTAGGYTTDALTAHIAERSRARRAAVGTEIDVVALIGAIRASTPAGVELTSIKVLDRNAGATGVAKSTSAAPTDTLGTVEIVGTAKDFSYIGSWSKQVARIKGISAVNPTWAGGGDAITTTLTATVNAAALTDRAVAATEKGK